MPLLLIIGGVLILAGLSLLVAWFGAFLILLKAALPLGVIGLGGLLAYFGWEERQDRRGAVMDFSSPAEANRYQADALAYQESLDQIGETMATGSLEAPEDGAPALAAAPLEIPHEEGHQAANSPEEGAPEAITQEGAAQGEVCLEKTSLEEASQGNISQENFSQDAISQDKAVQDNISLEKASPEESPQVEGRQGEGPREADQQAAEPRVVIESAPDDQPGATVTISKLSPEEE